MASAHICVQDGLISKEPFPACLGGFPKFILKKGKLGAISVFPLILEAPTGESLSPSLQLNIFNLSLKHILNKTRYLNMSGSVLLLPILH